MLIVTYDKNLALEVPSYNTTVILDQRQLEGGAQEVILLMWRTMYFLYTCWTEFSFWMAGEQ